MTNQASEQQRKSGGWTPGFDRAMTTARLLVEQGRATDVSVQDGKVYVDASCAGCGDKSRPHLVDPAPNQGDPWCPACGGRSLVALDMTDVRDYENGLCRISTSKVVHLVAPPYGQHPLCQPGCKVGRMRPANADTEVTCQRCIKARDGEAEFGINVDSEAMA